MPLLVSPTVHNLKVTKMLVGSEAGLNLISPDVIKRLQIPDSDLKPTGSFQGVDGGRFQPKGKITLPVTFGSELNFKTERVTFDVAKMSLSYNGVLGRPSLAKFMAASHHACNTLKMPGPMRIITIHADKKDTVLCVDKIYREAVAASTDMAPVPAENKSKTSGKTRDESGKRAAEHSTPVNDSPGTSNAGGKKNSDHPQDEASGRARGRRTTRGYFHHKCHPRQQIGKHAISFLQANVDVFAWQPSDIPGVPKEVTEHHLVVCPRARPVKQKV